MKIHCHYHPTRLAEWTCPSCETALCGSCVSTRTVEQYGAKRKFHFCPKCEVEAERLGSGNTIVPFWNRLPKFFAYPFHPRVLIFITVLSVARIFFSGVGLFGGLIRVAVWGVLLKYSFSALKNTAQGGLAPPKMGYQTLSEDFGTVFKQLGIFVIMGLAIGKVFQAAGMFIGFLFLCFAVLSIPAMIIVLVATNSLLQAVNPMIFVRMSWRIGWGYLLMYLFLVLLGAAPTVLGRYVIAYFPAICHGFLYSMAESFYTIISYHLMGYVIFQYHEEIGYEVSLDGEELTEHEQSGGQGEDNELINRVNIFIQEGKIDEAIALIHDETGNDISDPDLAERYYNLLKIRERIPEMLDHAKRYLDLLSKTTEKAKMSDIYLECLAKDPAFNPTSQTLFKIASCLNESGNPKEAVQAYNRFIKANPRNSLVPKAYFLAASIINEKLNNPRKASGILEQLIKKYPNHEILPYLESYLRRMRTSQGLPGIGQ